MLLSLTGVESCLNCHSLFSKSRLFTCLPISFEHIPAVISWFLLFIAQVYSDLPVLLHINAHMDAHSKNHSDMQVYTGKQTTKATHGSNTVKCLICSHVQGEHAWNRAFCCCCRRYLCAPFSWAAERHKGSTESRAQQDPPDAAYPYSLLRGHGANMWKVTGGLQTERRQEWL